MPTHPAVVARAAVVTVSDTRSLPGAEDRGGDLAADRLRTLPAEVVRRVAVPDETVAVREAVAAVSAEADVVVVTGGTGLAPRDVTPQAVRPLLDYEVPGMAEAMRAAGLRRTPHAMLSRQVVGVRGHCLVMALPGSPGGVDDCLDAVWEALPHALGLLAGRRDPHRATEPGR